MTKKYILKPGMHQFAPGSAAVHNNDILTDEEAEWYLQKYPHIAALFNQHAANEEIPAKLTSQVISEVKVVNIMQNDESVEQLTPPFGGKGDQ